MNFGATSHLLHDATVLTHPGVLKLWEKKGGTAKEFIALLDQLDRTIERPFGIDLNIPPKLAEIFFNHPLIHKISYLNFHPYEAKRYPEIDKLVHHLWKADDLLGQLDYREPNSKVDGLQKKMERFFRSYARRFDQSAYRSED